MQNKTTDLNMIAMKMVSFHNFNDKSIVSWTWLQSLNSPILSIDAKHEGNDYLIVAGYIYDCKDYDTLEHKYMVRFSKWHL